MLVSLHLSCVGGKGFGIVGCNLVPTNKTSISHTFLLSVWSLLSRGFPWVLYIRLDFTPTLCWVLGSCPRSHRWSHGRFAVQGVRVRGKLEKRVAGSEVRISVLFSLAITATRFPRRSLGRLLVSSAKERACPQPGRFS